jgi:hypothetical protein
LKKIKGEKIKEGTLQFPLYIKQRLKIREES